MRSLISILVSLILLNLSLYSQENEKLVSAFNYLKSKELDKAKLDIDVAIKDVNVQWSPKAWFIKAMVYHAIYESKVRDYYNLHENPLDEAYQAYIKTLEFDENKEYNVDIRKRLLVVSNQYSNKGINEFNEYKYNEALNSFEKSLEIQKMPMIMNLDTMGIYNAAMAAMNAKKNAKAKEYFHKLAEINYGGGKVYMHLANIYIEERDNAKAIELLLKSIELNPNEYNLLINKLINVYLTDNQYEKAKEYLEQAITKNPNNPEFFQVLAGLYDSAKDFDIVEKNLLKSVELNPNYVEANYKLGVLYFNTAILQNQTVNELTDNNAYKAEKHKVEEWFKKSIPYFEKVHELNPKEENSIKNLKFLYERYNIQDKLILLNK
ncbi:MAG: hypothetical protein A2W98_04600 [Bacteroidetes bacterium GWF2_33_38]|nr:MAG: hypothetical protein A2W98_04600 [Bacteroidetes bacterium GWF2_33_38]OFY73246.1 MAG: hypothetical protein A2265_09330 [Bacteroidetes bacterium RIFOXYA12_FULL_33_9]OFY90798.1 MAG: hypothetical protein A2236_07480 [Bacteroidetes bacterium RIFOXYA2_FULL_33_7]